MFLTFGAVILLLACSAFFSGSETALTAVSRGRMHQLEQDGSRAAACVNKLVGNRERMIGALLLGNTFINILASSLMTATLQGRFGPRTVAITTGIMTVVILMFAEVLPKTLAIARTDRFALAVAPPLRRIVAVLAPIVAAVQWIVWRLLSPFGVQHGEAPTEEAAHEEIRGSVALHHKEGAVEREHRDMIGGILDLSTLRVGDVMQHRKNLASVDGGLPPREIVREVLETHHTRVPLWKDEPENIIGVINLKPLAQAVIHHKGDLDTIDIPSLTVPPWFVPDTTMLEEQLSAFRERRSHFALVVDEYGALQGLITLEDILGEIFGEIPDELQLHARPDVRQRPDGSYLIDGTVSVRELNRELDWNLPDDGPTTIAGLVIQEARTIPEPGQRFAFFGFEFEVLRRQRNQITALRVIPPAARVQPEKA
ncbi:MAG TPA: HlyC/CorC family transporter [Rhizomicrobium sp.]|jgi:Mg2+/Co2+ transporter CorB|nr:HlyC/CorC family transporter [Rhizomicrobium sp.]